MAILELTLRLTQDLGVPTKKALQLAHQSLEAGHYVNRLPVADSVVLLVDVEHLTADVARRLGEAVEIAPSPRRGRPPR